MSNIKIGEYIHASYRNYEQYGIQKSQDTQPKVINIDSVLKNQLDKLRKRAKQLAFGGNKEKLRKELETGLNFFGPTGKIYDLGYTESEIEAMRRRYQQTVSKAAHTVASKIDWNTLSVYGTGVSNANLRQRVNELNPKLIDKTNKYNKYTTIMSRLKTLQEIFKGINFRGANDKQLYAQVQEMYNYAETTLKKVADRNNGQIDVNFMRKGAQVSFWEEVNELIKRVRGVNNINAQGIVGEVAGAYSLNMYHSIIGNETQNLISPIVNVAQRIASKDRSTKVLKSNNFIVNSNSGASSYFTYFDETGKTTFKTHPTENKVDIEVELPELGKIDMSVKNVNLQMDNNIKILSGTSILQRLQDYPDFTNHYLNITAKNLPPNENAETGDVIKANKVLKKTLLLHALIGDEWSIYEGQSMPVKNKSANTFVVNDNSKKQGYKVYFMSDILNTVFDDNDDKYISLDNFSLSQRWNNNWQGAYNEPNYSDAYKRILKMLMQLHSFKISVGLHKSALDN